VNYRFGGQVRQGVGKEGDHLVVPAELVGRNGL
jgi:hypothetical protein